MSLETPEPPHAKPRLRFARRGTELAVAIILTCFVAACSQDAPSTASAPAAATVTEQAVAPPAASNPPVKNTPSDQCPADQHRLSSFEGCVPKTLEASFATRSVEVGVLAPIDPQKLADVVNIDALRDSIRPYVAMDPSRGEALCSLFQTGKSDLRSQDVRWLEGIARRDPEIEGRYLALTLAAILTKKASSATVDAVLKAIQGRMTRAMDSQPPDRARTRRMLANYLMTARVFRAKQTTPEIRRASEFLFPTRTLPVPKKLQTGFLEEVVVTHLLGWKLPTDEIRKMIERSRKVPKNPKSHVKFADCKERPCDYKAYQTIMSIDQLIGIWTPSERQAHLKELLTKLENRSIFGHVRDYGLEPKDLWISSRCDYFCSVKHWTVLVTLNHLLHTTSKASKSP